MYSDDYSAPSSQVTSARSSRPSARASGRAPLPPLSNGAKKTAARALSSQTARVTGKPQQSAQPRSASSLDNPRRVSGRTPATLQPLASARDSTAATAAELMRVNRSLREELLAVNKQLDEALAMRGQRVNFNAVPSPPAKGKETALDKQAAKNDQQRKANAELRRRIRTLQEIDRVSDVANDLGSKAARLQELRDEVRGQENVIAHQDQQLTVVRRAEAEMAALRQEHSEEVSAMKERTRQAREQREQEQRAFSRVMQQVDRVEEKVKLQADIGDAVRSVGDMQEQVEEKDRLIEALRYQVSVLSKSGAADRKRGVSEKVAREVASLREEADLLRQRLGAADMAQELGVDVRV